MQKKQEITLHISKEQFNDYRELFKGAKVEFLKPKRDPSGVVDYEVSVSGKADAD